MKFVGSVFLSVMCLCFTAGPLAAQETINYGTISGRVTDPQGAVVPGASVNARHVETNLTRDTVTDQDGRFRFPYLRVGHYEIVVRLAGFADASSNVTVTVGSAFELPLKLAVAGLDTSVTVTADSTVLEAARSQIAGTVSQSEVQTLPLNGRNFLDLALLIPGVSPTNTGSTQLFAETSAVPGQGISVGSQRNFSNNFIVDGLSANDDAAGLERHSVRRRRSRSVSGCDFRRAGRARTRAWRIRQRRHEERHERACTATSTDISAMTRSTPAMLCRPRSSR